MKKLLYLVATAMIVMMSVSACSDDEKTAESQKGCYLGEMIMVDRKSDLGEIRVVTLPDNVTSTQANSQALPAVNERIVFHLSDLSNDNYEVGRLLYFKVMESVPQDDQGYRLYTQEDPHFTSYRCKLADCK